MEEPGNWIGKYTEVEQSIVSLREIVFDAIRRNQNLIIQGL